MPSVKWAIAIEKKNTATAKRRVFYFAYFPVSCPKTDAGFELSGARLPQNRRPLLGRKRGCGVRYSHLEAVLQAYVAAP